MVLLDGMLDGPGSGPGIRTLANKSTRTLRLTPHIALSEQSVRSVSRSQGECHVHKASVTITRRGRALRRRRHDTPQ